MTISVDIDIISE